MKRILFVIQSYPSAMSANVLCDDQIMMQLMESRDYEIHVLCMRHPDQPFEEIVNGLNIHRVYMGKISEQYWSARSSCDSYKKRASIASYRLRMRFQQLAGIPKYPYSDKRAIRIFDAAAERLHSEYKFDLVVAEHYGMETMHAGLNLKERNEEIKYIQVFWDSMSGGFRPRYLPVSFVDHRRVALEGYIFSKADLSIAMTSHMSNLLKTEHGRRAYEDSRLKFLGIPYLRNAKRKSGVANPLQFDSEKKNLLFAGNLWERNLEPFVKALSQINQTDCCLWIVTGSDTKGIEAQLSKYEIDLRFHTYVQHDQLTAALSEADVLVNFGVKNPNAISGKIIEYIGYCKPIISTFAIENEACISMLQKYPCRFFFDECNTNVSKEANSLNSFLESCNDSEIQFDVIAEEYAYCLPESYCEFIDNILKGDVNE